MNSNDIHPASPGCRPGTYPLIEEEAEEELQNKQTTKQDNEEINKQPINASDTPNMRYYPKETRRSHQG